jgi:superfamily II DNA or RNA helicase
MSRKIDIATLTDKDLETISSELQIVQEPSKYDFSQKPKCIYLFDQEKNDVFVPFSYQRYEGKNRPPRDTLFPMNTHFSGVLREEQKQVYNSALSILNKKGSVIIASYPSFGKTFLGILLACKTRLKTLIVCHRIILIKQWKESIQKFSNGKVQILDTKSILDKTCDFFIMNAINIPKKSRNFFSGIGTLIVDEIHVIMAEKFSECMKHIIPRYVIGLSATPYRVDGLNSLMNIYFGEEKIEKKLFRKHMVYCMYTSIAPDVKINKMGRIDWSSVIESLSENNERNEMIVRILKFFKDRTFLVLCKRISQAKYLLRRLQEEKQSVTDLVGTKQDFDTNSRILIGTTGKVGIGFDHVKLNALLFACDIEQYFIQYLGRVFRSKETEPLIVDIIDDHPILKKHHRTRLAVYKEHGGIVKDFSREYPDFS